MSNNSDEHLDRRFGRFVYRRPLPAELREASGITELVEPLPAKSTTEARRMRDWLDARIDYQWVLAVEILFDPIEDIEKWIRRLGLQEVTVETLNRAHREVFECLREEVAAAQREGMEVAEKLETTKAPPTGATSSVAGHVAPVLRSVTTVLRR